MYRKSFIAQLNVIRQRVHCITEFGFPNKQISEIQQPLTYNDFTAKVFSLYELIYHGLATFVRSLSHFVGTKVPDKLPKLLSCIQEATRLCVQFDFFDRQDSIVVVSNSHQPQMTHPDS